jgi:hypothetical protein
MRFEQGQSTVQSATCTDCCCEDVRQANIQRGKQRRREKNSGSSSITTAARQLIWVLPTRKPWAAVVRSHALLRPLLLHETLVSKTVP